MSPIVPVVNALDPLAVHCFIVALQADYDIQFLLTRLLRGLQNLSHTRSIGGHRFLHEDMLVGFDGGLEVNRAESRRCCDEHDVNERYHLPVRIESDELLFVRHIDPRAIVGSTVRGLFAVFWIQQIRKALVQPITKSIGHRHEFDILTAAQSLERSARATAATTNQSNPDGIIRCVVSVCAQWKPAGHQRTNNGRRSLDEITATDRFLVLTLVHLRPHVFCYSGSWRPTLRVQVARSSPAPHALTGATGLTSRNPTKGESVFHQ